MTSDDSGGRRQRILLAVAAVILIVAGVLAWRRVDKGSKYKVSAERAFKCTECGQVFEHTLKRGDGEPLKCSECGKQAGWRAETCYWTKDAGGQWKAKLDPTFVLQKERMGIDERTFCPDCGREVVGHNPKPPQELMDEARAKEGQ